jgi:hypothetical protein
MRRDCDGQEFSVSGSIRLSLPQCRLRTNRQVTEHELSDEKQVGSIIRSGGNPQFQFDSAPLWEIRLAWVLRIPILGTAAFHLDQGTLAASSH